ncbi:PAAR domain-containing protein [Klebsiella pneumoniae]|nr:PAAR domain-containing protein [Klebsiella pneumoniae]
MAIGHFLFRGDKTACGGRILEGCPNHQFFDKDMACEGHKVTCGKHPGIIVSAVALIVTKYMVKSSRNTAQP